MTTNGNGWQCRCRRPGSISAAVNMAYVVGVLLVALGTLEDSVLLGAFGWLFIIGAGVLDISTDLKAPTEDRESSNVHRDH